MSKNQQQHLAISWIVLAEMGKYRLCSFWYGYGAKSINEHKIKFHQYFEPYGTTFLYFILFLDKQKQAVPSSKEDLNQTRISYKELEERMESALNTQLQGSLDDACACRTTAQQMGDKEKIEEELQKPLQEEKCERSRKQVITDRDELAAERFGSEQFTSSMTHQHNLHIDEVIIWEQRSALEDKSDLGISVEDRPKVLHVEVTEEMSSYGSTKGMQSADSAAQEELTTKLESKYFMGKFKDELQKTSTKVEEEFRQLRSSLHELEGGLENKLDHMHQKINDEICLRHTREGELREKKALIDELKTTLEEEQQMRTRVEGELRETKTVCTEMEETIHDLVKMFLTSENENDGRTLKEQESKENETIILELQKMLGEEQEARTKVEEELKQVRTAYNELQFIGATNDDGNPLLHTELLFSYYFQMLEFPIIHVIHRDLSGKNVLL